MSAVEAASEVEWWFPDLEDDEIDSYKLERQTQVPEGRPEQSWEVLQDAITGTLYDDHGTAAGFTYKYRVTAYYLSGVEKKHETDPVEGHPRKGFYGFGKSESVVLSIVPTDEFPAGDYYQVTRYTGPSDSQGTVIHTSRTADPIDDQLTDDKIYRYILHVGNLVDGDFVPTQVGNVAEIFLKAGQPDLAAVPSVVKQGSGRSFRIDWTPPESLHRSQFALYEISRKNAKDWKAEWEVIGTTTGLNGTKGEQFKPPLVGENESFDYSVRVVGWEHEHGPDSLVIPRYPEIKPPKCETLDGTTLSGNHEVVRSMEIMRLGDRVPVNKWYGFYIWAAAGSSTSPPFLACGELDLSDWYVQRAVYYHHPSPDTCQDTAEGCQVVSRPSLADAGPFDYVEGAFREDSGGSMPVLVWYDQPNPVAGLYRYVYQTCSYYANPRFCTSKVASDWRFEGLDSIEADP